MSIFSGDSRTAWVQAFASGIPYAAYSGMQVVDVGKGLASLLLPARDTWTGDRQRNLIHPGCLSVLADTACGMAVGCAMDEMEPFATLDLRMDYLRPPVANINTICRAECHRLSRSVAFVRGEVFQLGQPDPVATVNATFMRATASTRRKDLPTPPTPSEAASNLMPQTSLDVSHFVRSIPADTPETPVVSHGRSPYVDFLNIHQQAQVDAGPVFRLPFKPELVGNPMLPALHGGVLAGFGETAMLLHLKSHNPDIDVPRSVDFAIAYMRSAKPIDTYAQCSTVRQGNRVALAQVSIWQDDPQRPVANARGHFLMPRDET
ncbi:MAG TPA: hotdog domain-containing protein [Aquabacterium sp.]|nr:hotdog domain-containing protein [Aquabacterium sp.]